jgi:TonB-linked SusC/RagA family outer membrane protein
MKTKFNGILTLLLAFVVQLTFAQEKTISGTVVDETNMPLPGATVLIKGTTTGASTDFDGKYSISANTGDVLTFSYVGYSEKNATVGASNTINVSLELDNSLEEIVVVGFSSKKRTVLSSAVSTVGTKQLEQVSGTTNIANALQGQASGVNVVAQNGKPGQTAFVNIRGISSSDPDLQPLYILDGAPISADDLGLVNSSDVESVSILKDAATAAMYGSSASAGVVVITTKGGKRNQDARFTFSSTVGFTQKIKDNFEMMNAEQKLRYGRELNEGTGANVTNQAEWDGLVAQGHDWQDTLLKKGFMRSTSIAMNGGSENTSYYVSLKNEEDTGIIDGLDGFDRSTAKVNLNFDANDWLSFDVRTAAAYTRSQEPRDRNNVQNPFRAMYSYNPYETLYNLDADGNPVLDINGNPVYNNTHQGFSISEALRNNPESEDRLKLNASFGANARIVKGLVYSPKLSINYSTLRSEAYTQPGSVLDGYVGDAEAPGSKRDNGNYVFRHNFQNVLKYNTTFNEKHNLGLTALSEYNNREFYSYSFRSKGFPTPEIDVHSAAADADGTPTTTKTERTKMSIAGSVDYDFDEKYIATASLRRDGTSRFGENNQYGTFWSASLAWNIARESFLEGKAFDDLKLRASYGTLGNDNLNSYPYQLLYGFDGYNGQTAAFPTQNANPDLQWEEKAILDVGVEFSLFNRRLRGVVDYYKANVTNLLFSQNLAFESGSPGNPSVQINAGEFETNGYEFELSGDIIKNNNLTWTAGGNIGFSETIVKELVDGADLIQGGTILREDEEAFTHYLVRYAGVNPANGEALYYDKDGNVTNRYSADDAVALSGKSVTPDFTGSFFTSVAYKGFDVSTNFYFKYGNYIYNQMEADMLSDGENIADNQRLDAFNYWRNPGDTNVLPNPLLSTDTNQASDRFLQDGSYLRLRSAEIGYTLPSKYSERLRLNSLRVYVQGQNLWTYAPTFKGDPEVGIGSGETAQDARGEYNLYSYPTLQSFLFGVNVSF